MSQIVEIRIPPDKLEDREYWKVIIAKNLKVGIDQIGEVQLIKRSIDARGKSPKFQLRIKVYDKGEEIKIENWSFNFQNIEQQSKVIIVGAGPCGYFAALKCIEIGLCPIVLDRGKNVRDRRKDLRQIQQFHIVNPDSNYCFGEGGAGTYSDGKLYTRSVKRGNVKRILHLLVEHGASTDILIDAHPHIGSNKLPRIIAAIRETIIKCGGQIHFNTRIEDFRILRNRIQGVVDQYGNYFEGKATILCTGHGARDIYNLCAKKGMLLEFKPFALGMRLEHPQELIDEIQYGSKNRGDHLPAASYSLSCQVDNRGVFSFCMCPGGLIVPAATAPGELVVNGMSLSKRDSPFANAAVVVAVNENFEFDNPFAGLNYQQKLEQQIFNFGDGSQRAPAQRLTDFIDRKVSASLPDSSYIPGIYSAPLHELMPRQIVNRINKAIKSFDQKMSGYYTEEAQFVGLESRTSAPVRIPRDNLSLMNPDIKALFPAGEGAGYAGGILSAALDGERVAVAVGEYLT